MSEEQPIAQGSNPHINVVGGCNPTDVSAWKILKPIVVYTNDAAALSKADSEGAIRHSRDP